MATKEDLQVRRVVIIIIIVCISNLPAWAKYSGGNGTIDYPYKIAEPNDWIELMNTSTDWDKCFLMTADIDVNGVFLTPVGNYLHEFTGIFDGNNFVIYNADVNMPNDNYVGLFGYVDPNGQINNLGLENIKISGYNCVGGLVGNSTVGTISNCYCSGVISGYEVVGGLVGNNFWGTVTGCCSTVTINGGYSIGGLIGSNVGDVNNSYSTGTINGYGSIGGLVGTSAGDIINSYFTGTVNGRGSFIGGLVGAQDDSSVLNCTSTGTVNGDNYVGGLLGFNKGTVTDCNSISTVIGDDYVGGLIGKNDQGSVTNCYNICIVIGYNNVGGLLGSSDSGDVTNSNSICEVSGDRSVGGLVGGNYDCYVSNCYTKGTVSGDYGVGGLIGGNSGYVSDCYSDCIISGYESVGGFIGGNYGNIASCYSIGTVGGIEAVGGLLGENYGDVTNCYSTCAVSGYIDIGGLVGSHEDGNVTKCYSTGTVSGYLAIGGLIGANYSDMNDCFWDIETSFTFDGIGDGDPDPNGVVGKTTAELQTQNTFIIEGLWDFIGETENGPNDIWKIWDGYDYPRLAWESGPNTPLVFVDINDPGFCGQMSKYEVTNTQYCDFLNSALASGDITISGTDIYGAVGLNSGTDYIEQCYYLSDGLGYTGYGATNGGAARIHYSEGMFSVDEGFDNHPVTYVSWYGAMAFANYYGYYLPTEDQWQAVADYDGTYIYGCGESIDPSIANYRFSEHPDGTVPVGSFGIYGYGMSDMAGNVWEWTCSSLDINRICCGGSLGSIDSDCTVPIRLDSVPNSNYWDIGFRVCR